MPTISSTIGSSPVELNVNDAGGDGLTVVLIHGWPLSAESWAGQVPALTNAGYRVVSYDRRGFGKSSKPDGGYDYDTMAGDLDAVINGLELDKPVIVGFSMGGGEVARYIGRFGTGNLSGAVFASAVPPYLLKTDDNPDGGLGESDIDDIKSGLDADRDSFYEDFAKSFYTADGELKVSDDVLIRWRDLAAPGSTKAALDCIDAFARTDFRDDLAKVDVPTLVIHGAADGTVPIAVSGERTQQTIDGAEFVVIDDGPHGILDSHTDEVNTALLGFLDKLS